MNKKEHYQLNLLEAMPKAIRNTEARKKNKSLNRSIALKFGKEYFDGTREQGYGGYIYDGRWKKVAHKLIKIFNLKSGSKILDIGCAKGFLLYDLKQINPNFELHGIEISKYAISKSPKSIQKFIQNYSCEKINFPDNYFDCVLAINTIHNLPPKKCSNAIKEIQRVSNGNAFIQVDAYRNEGELKIFKDWMLTAKTFLTPKEWIALFKSSNYKGYYDWTILEVKN